MAKRKIKITNRVGRRNWSDQARPMMTGGTNIRYELDGRREGIGWPRVRQHLMPAPGVGSCPRWTELSAASSRNLDLIPYHLV